jgi:hypothetical protein
VAIQGGICDSGLLPARCARRRNDEEANDRNGIAPDGSSSVMAALDPRIKSEDMGGHPGSRMQRWMAGSGPAMTAEAETPRVTGIAK